MNEQLELYRNKLMEIWKSTSTKKKILIGVTILFLLAAIVLTVQLASKTEFVPLYNSELSEAEVGEIKSQLDASGVKYQLSPSGTSIMVPAKQRAEIVTSLASEGFPRTGAITYKDITENMGLGVTDSQFNLQKQAALQSEIERLIERGIDSIESAQVILDIPEKSYFLTDEEDVATASVVVRIRPGFQLDQAKVNGLYHLVSKSVPNLPTEEIVIMDQTGKVLEMVELDESGQNLSGYEQQRQVKKDIERDIKRELEALLGKVLGPDQVIVSVFATLNFDKQTTQQQLVEPVTEDGKGIATSEEKITESFTGEGAVPGGVVGTGQGDIPGYPGVTGTNGNSEYERVEQRVQSEVNRISREIVSSPYYVEDLAITVAVDVGEQANSDEQIAVIEGILRSVVQTSLANSPRQMTDEELAQRINVLPQTFQKIPVPEAEKGVNPLILYLLAALAALALAGLAFVLVKRKKREEEELDQLATAPKSTEIPDIPYEESEGTMVRKQLEKLAQQKPEDFVGVLRTWLADD